MLASVGPILWSNTAYHVKLQAVYIHYLIVYRFHVNYCNFTWDSLSVILKKICSSETIEWIITKYLVTSILLGKYDVEYES